MKVIPGPGVQPQVREAFASLSDGLPFCRGKYIYIDGLKGTENAAGTFTNPFKSIEDAVSVIQAGDCVVQIGQGVSSAAASSYVTKPVAWTFNDVIFYGLNANSSIAQRARISNKTKVTTGALTTISFTNSGTADYISRTAGSFITDGFKVGQRIRVDSTSNTNDGVYTVLTVTALRITLSTADSLTTEDATTAGATTITNYLPYLVHVTGSNNTFINISCFNSDTDVAAIGGWNDYGTRNTYINCNFVGGAGAAAVATAYDFYAYNAAELIFEGCTFGTDTINRGNFASANLLLDGTVGSGNFRLRFKDCEFLSWADGGTARLAVKSGSADSIGRNIVFKGCIFHCYMENHGTAQAVAFGGTTPTSSEALVDANCGLKGYAAWSANTDWVYNLAPTSAASAGGGIATVL